MSEYLNRRKFLKKSLVMSAGATAALSFEEQALLAKIAQKQSKPVPEDTIKGLQNGKIGNYKISRLICGGNLIGGWAHSRDLIYVSELLKHYFTDEKILETLQICEENGINVAALPTDKGTIRILNKYWKERGGKIQWIAQTYGTANEYDQKIYLKMGIDNGAIGAYIHGGAGDNLCEKGHIDIIGKLVSFIKENGLLAGVGCHMIEVPMTVEKEGIEPDFYFKTLNNVNYNSATPQKTIEFMRKLNKPWVAFKVLGAGVTHPREGFKYAFKNGADFLCVGMFDFQIKEDILVAKRELSDNSQRERPWRA